MCDFVRDTNYQFNKIHGISLPITLSLYLNQYGADANFQRKEIHPMWNNTMSRDTIIANACGSLDSVEHCENTTRKHKNMIS